MAQVDLSMYRQAPSGMQSLGNISQTMASIPQMMRQSKMADLAMQDRQLKQEQDRARYKREERERERIEAERKRQLAQRDNFMSNVQTMQMEGEEQLTPEQMQSAYAQAYPQKYAEQQVKSALSRDPYAGRRIAVQEAEHKRKSAKDIASMSKFNERQQLEREKFYLTGQKSKEQIRQFEESLKMKREEIALELGKPERERTFAQEGYRLQLPEYLQGKVNPKKVFVQTEVTKLKDANNSYGDIFKKVNDLETLVPSASDYLAAKGTGETAGLVKSQVAQIITDYNRNVAELGALAGQDLTILEEAIPSPSQWKAMTYLTWKKTIQNLKKNIKEKYQGLMRNSEINVSGNMLDKISSMARVTNLTDDDEGLIRK